MGRSEGRLEKEISEKHEGCGWMRRSCGCRREEKEDGGWCIGRCLCLVVLGEQSVVQCRLC